VDADTGNIMESHASTLFWCGRSIKNNWPKGTMREWKPMCISKCARFAVGDQPYFLAQIFIEAANYLKTNRIKLPCEPTYVFDVNKYPPNSNTFYSFLSHRLPLYTSSLERSNIIIIITCSFVIVFAFNHLYLSVIRT